MDRSDPPAPGIRWLAERIGRDPDELLQDRNALVYALAGAGRDAIEVIARLESAEPATRARARAEVRALRLRMDSDTHSPDQRLASRLVRALDEATDRMRAERERGPQ